MDAKESLDLPRYVIQFLPAPNWCIGVMNNPAINSPAVLLEVNSENTTWLLNPATGIIALASNPALVLTIEGATPENQTPLCVSPLQELNINQQWDWLSNPPLVVAATNRTFCIDNRNGLSVTGNVVQVYQQMPDDGNQQWQIFKVV